MNRDYDKDKVDGMTLALLYLVTHGDEFGARAWKGFDLAAAYERGSLLLRDVALS